MELLEFTTFHENGIEKIGRVRFMVSDSSDPDERKEWIEAQVSIDVPTLRNGADLRARALQKARDELDKLIKGFEHLAETIPRGR